MSIASGMSIGISRCTWRSDCPESLSVVIQERKAVFIRFSPLNDLSAEHVVTGKVQRILINALMLGYIEVVSNNGALGVRGKAVSPMILQLLLPLYLPAVQLTVDVVG